MVGTLNGVCQRDQAALFASIQLFGRVGWTLFVCWHKKSRKKFLIRTWAVRFNLYDSAMEVKGGECVRMNDRQQQLISLLCQRRSDSIQNLAMELGVCERTIRRDITQSRLSVADMAVGSGWQTGTFRTGQNWLPNKQRCSNA
jgi:hypothetical protein